MDQLLALVAAVIGGSLVLLGDAIRRRVEKRAQEVLRLVEAAAQLSAMYNRLCGQLLDAVAGDVSMTQVPSPDPLRYELTTRFFMTPGSEQLSAQASRLITSYMQLRSSYGQHEAWEAARSEHAAAVRAFEAAVRSVLHRGHI